MYTFNYDMLLHYVACINTSLETEKGRDYEPIVEEDVKKVLYEIGFDEDIAVKELILQR